jgi:hypothetical protein
LRECLPKNTRKAATERRQTLPAFYSRNRSCHVLRFDKQLNANAVGCGRLTPSIVEAFGGRLVRAPKIRVKVLTMRDKHKSLVAAAFLLTLALIPCQVVGRNQVRSQNTPTSSSSGAKEQPNEAKEKDKNCSDNGTYLNSKGETVKRPETCASAPKGATARCRDGSYSFSHSHQGTCSHHGGVAKWLP